MPVVNFQQLIEQSLNRGVYKMSPLINEQQRMQAVSMMTGLLGDHLGKKINQTKFHTDYLKLLKDVQKLAQQS